MWSCARRAPRPCLKVTIRPGQQRTVLFPLVAPGEAPGPAPGLAPSGPGTGALLARLTVAGIKFGAIIAITAIGLSLIFGTTNLINFAHGELVTIGAMTAFFLNAATAGPGWGLIPAALVAVAVGALVGAGLELGMWRPLRSRGTGRIQLFIISIGLSLFLRHLLLVIRSPSSSARSRSHRGIWSSPCWHSPCWWPWG